MASDSELPTWPEIENHALQHLDAARNEMSEVRSDWLRSDWLRSDWRPIGSPLTDSQASARARVLYLVSEVKDLIDRARWREMSIAATAAARPLRQRRYRYREPGGCPFPAGGRLVHGTPPAAWDSGVKLRPWRCAAAARRRPGAAAGPGPVGCSHSPERSGIST